MQLEEGTVTLTVRVKGAYHYDEQVQEERSPASHKHAKKNGESQGTPYTAPPLLTGSW